MDLLRRSSRCVSPFSLQLVSLSTNILSSFAIGSLTAQLKGGQSCSNSTLTYCNSLEALLAFNWINWILVTIMLAFVTFIGAGAFRGGRGIKEGLH